MIVSDVKKIEGRVFPARRRTQPFVGGSAPIQAEHFSLGLVTFEPDGGQVPWHNQTQEEIYFVLEGRGEMCLGSERQTLEAGQAVYIPPGEYHQLTNTGDVPLKMIYCCAAGFVAHPQQEMDGTLPRAGVDVPALPGGARPQHTDPPIRDERRN